MGEQTQVQTQTQTQQQPQTLTQHESAMTSFSSTTIAPASTGSTALSNAPVQTSFHPSKIPFRPRKIRKLSPDDSDLKFTETVGVSENPNHSVTPISATAKPTKSKLVQSRAMKVSRIVARSLSCDGEVENALRHLRAADPILAPLIDMHQPPTFDNFQTPFLALTRSILYQQLAFKAGTSIYTRFIALCGGEMGVVPEIVLALTPQQLRQIGVSGRKASYLHDLARKYKNEILSDTAIVNMDDKSLFTMLTMVNGIGSWSVHMFMIFSLHRPDVLPINDLGIRKGVQLLYNLQDLPRPSQMEQLCEKWKPYRSVASWYMWRFVEAKGAPSSAAAVASGASLQQQQPQPGESQQQQQPQLMDPLNILNIGSGPAMDKQYRACAWGH